MTKRLLLSSLLLFLLTSLSAAPRIINFSGYDWIVRSAYGLTPPGPNYFTNNEDSVWVDDSGYLHLTISLDQTANQDRWLCGEVTCREKMGYGKYSITVEGRIDKLDPQTVFGFFTWDKQNPPHYSEIDIEFARWGDPAREIGQFTLQPYTEAENQHVFPIDLEGALTTHTIIWEPGKISFESRHGGDPEQGSLIARWVREGEGIPIPGKSSIHLNLWLFQGKSPQRNVSQHVIIRDFSFIPIP